MHQPIRSLYANITVKTLANQVHATLKNSSTSKNGGKAYYDDHANEKCQKFKKTESLTCVSQSDHYMQI